MEQQNNISGDPIQPICQYSSFKIPFNFHLVYKEMAEAMNKHPDADVMINFASLRSAYDATLEAMQFPQVKYWVK